MEWPRLLHTFGVDFFDTCAPVARMLLFCIIYALSVYLTLFIESMDVDLAFLNATLKVDAYIDSLLKFNKATVRAEVVA